MARRPATALCTASGCGLLALLIWVVAFHTDLGRSADAAAFYGFISLQGSAAERAASATAALCNVAPYALLAATIVLAGLAVRGPRHAAAAAVLLLVPSAITQFLKPTLATERAVMHGIDGVAVAPASWPSGHSTAAMSLALAGVIVAPVALRAVVAVAGGLFAIAVGYSVVLLGWHMPSDVLGGFAVAGGGAALAVAALWATDPRPAARPAPAWVPSGLLAFALTGAGVVLAAGVARIVVAIPSPHQQAAFLAIAAAIIALPLVLSGLAAGRQSA
jgi:membrane-associated phospholipid phosphatase